MKHVFIILAAAAWLALPLAPCFASPPSPAEICMKAAAQAGAKAQPPMVWSPDKKRFAVHLTGQKVAKGTEIERLAVYTSAGEEVAVAHVWDVEPDGTMRVGIRGCESWGWIDPAKLFCAGSVNPHVSVCLTFDASTGREIDEAVEPDISN
jgi:hypothetical protein